MVAVGSNFFYTVTLPCTLWFFDRGKRKTARADKVLFIDARHLYRQIDRAHRDWTPAQIEFLANIARLYRGEAVENLHDSADLLAEHFPDGQIRRRGRACARWRRWPRSKPRAGASTLAAMWAWPPGRGGLRLQGAAGGAERGTGNPQRRGPGTGRADRGECGQVVGGGVMNGIQRIDIIGELRSQFSKGLSHLPRN